MLSKITAASMLILLLSSCGSIFVTDPDVVIFTKTAGYRHSSIPDGIDMLKAISSEEGWTTLHTESAGTLHSLILGKPRLIVFLNTSGNILDDVTGEKLLDYVNAGGGFAGIHAAADTEYGSNWYLQLIGAWFADHPEIQDATLHHHTDIGNMNLDIPDPWSRRDEWYNFQTYVNELETLLVVDEGSYIGGTMGDFHPISWVRQVGSGYSWYTAMGHTKASYLEPDFINHIRSGLIYAMGD